MLSRIQVISKEELTEIQDYAVLLQEEENLAYLSFKGTLKKVREYLKNMILMIKSLVKLSLTLKKITGLMII